MIKFEKWYQENSWNIENHYDAENAYKAGAQSKQAEIYELQHKVKCEREISLFADKLCVDLQSQVDELRKQLDKIKTITDLRIEANLACSTPTSFMHGGLYELEGIRDLIKEATNEQ